jgi:hypothetical protein
MASERYFIVKEETYLHRARGLLQDENGEDTGFYDTEAVFRPAGSTVVFVEGDEGVDWDASEVSPLLVQLYDGGDENTLALLEETSKTGAKKQSAAVEEASKGEPPFEGYDDLTADEVIARLKEGDAALAAAVLQYEGAQTKPRKTVVEAANSAAEG